MMADAARYNVERGAQIIDINMGCPAKKVCNVAAGSALLQDEPLVAAIVEAVVAAVDGAGDAQDPHRLEPAEQERGPHRPDRRGRRHRRAVGARPHARMRLCRARRVRDDPRDQARVAHTGDRQRRHRHAGEGARGPRPHRRRRDHDRARGAGPAVDLPRDRSFPRDRRATAAAAGRRNASADHRAPCRPLRVLRRERRRAHCAQASRLVYKQARRRRCVPRSDEPAGKLGRPGRRRRPVFRRGLRSLGERLVYASEAQTEASWVEEALAA